MVLTKKIEVLYALNYLRHSTLGISENAHKKVKIFEDIKLEIFNSIETFFSIHKNLIFHLCPNMA